MFPDICVFKDIQAFSVGSHDTVFDSIVDHLHEMAGTVWSAVKIPLLSSSSSIFSSGGASCCIKARSQRREDRIEMLDDVLFTTNHEAIATFQTPDSATCTAVHVVDTLRFKFGGTSDIIMIVRITSINDNIAGIEMWNDGFQGRINRGSRNHQPDSAGFGKFTDQVFKR